MGRPNQTTINAAIETAKEPIADLNGWELVPGDPQIAKTTISARVPQTLSEWIANEAVRTKQTPSKLIALLLDEAISARTQSVGADVMVPVAVLHRMIDSIARQEAA